MRLPRLPWKRRTSLPPDDARVLFTDPTFQKAIEAVEHRLTQEAMDTIHTPDADLVRSRMKVQVFRELVSDIRRAATQRGTGDNQDVEG